jgi:hypothetical protein
MEWRILQSANWVKQLSVLSEHRDLIVTGMKLAGTAPKFYRITPIMVPFQLS